MNTETNSASSAREVLVQQKIRAGLTRDQAEEVVTRQEAHDANLAKQKTAEKPEEGDRRPKNAKG
jgi:hypothetical protein